jgi:hypothetical protein
LVTKALLTRVWLPRKIVSGGQTGADRAALDWARGQGIEQGGWCPRGRRALDGTLPPLYPLRETPSPAWRQRTEWNVRDSDATLIFNLGRLAGGTLKTRAFAETLGKPCRVFQLNQAPLDGIASEVVAWLGQGGFATLNIAGPREEQRPGIYRGVIAVLDRCLLVASTEGLRKSARGE